MTLFERVRDYLIEIGPKPPIEDLDAREVYIDYQIDSMSNLDLLHVISDALEAQ